MKTTWVVKPESRNLYCRQNSRRNAAVLVAGIAASAVLLAACGSSSDSSGGSKTIKLGSFAPLSGPAVSASDYAKGAEVCFKQANASGGVNGYKFDYQILDDQYNPARTPSVTRVLVEKNKVFALVSTVGTAQLLAVKGYLDSQKVPVVGAGTGGSSAASDNIYILLQSYANEGAFQLKFASDNFSGAKLGAIYQNDAVGQPDLVGYKAEAKSLGLSDFVAVPYTAAAADLTPQVSKLKAAGIEVVMEAGGSADYPRIVKAMDALNYHPKIIAASYQGTVRVLKGLPTKSTDGKLFFSSITPPSNDPALADLRAGFAKYAPKLDPIPGTSLLGYAGCLMFKDAFKQMTDGGTKPTRPALLKILNGFKNYSNVLVKNITYAPSPGVTAPHAPRPDMSVWTYKNGVVSILKSASSVPKVPGEPTQ